MNGSGIKPIAPGNARESDLWIIGIAEAVTNSDEIERLVISPDCHGPVFEYWNSDILQRRRDMWGVFPMVVISGHGVDAKWCVKVFQDRRCSLNRKVPPANHSGNYEIASKQDQVRLRGVRQFHHPVNFGVVDEWRSGMKIANHGNAELTDLPGIASRKKDFMVNRPDAGRLDPECVHGQADRHDKRECPKRAAEWCWFVWLWHPQFHIRTANYDLLTSQNSGTR